MKKIIFAALLVASQLSHAEWFAAAITPAPSQVIWLNVAQPGNTPTTQNSAPGVLNSYLQNVNLYSIDTAFKLNVLSQLPSYQSGTTVYIGAGTSKEEMIASGRYRAFYIVP